MVHRVPTELLHPHHAHAIGVDTTSERYCLRPRPQHPALENVVTTHQSRASDPAEDALLHLKTGD
ncbi:hypothetical protein ACSNOI_40450 [Actinomadura kijaniata]|uniref:hypothetical protein n=1 Tax=Actinomadura kijaniata TaxID=46161 RepID=UPI003F1ABBD5